MNPPLAEHVMKRQHTPVEFSHARDLLPIEPNPQAASAEAEAPHVLAGRTIVIGIDGAQPPSAAPLPLPLGQHTLLMGSPEPTFRLTRQPIAIPSLQPTAAVDPEDLIRTKLRQASDPEDLIRTRIREQLPEEVEAAEALLKTRLEPHEFLDTVALRELEIPPEVEARLPALPPPPPPKRTQRPQRRAAAPNRRHVLSRTIKHPQTAPLKPLDSFRRPGARTVWLLAAALGACSMALAYLITDRIVSAREASRTAVLREAPPEPRAAAGTPAQAR